MTPGTVRWRRARGNKIKIFMLFFFLRTFNYSNYFVQRSLFSGLKKLAFLRQKKISRIRLIKYYQYYRQGSKCKFLVILAGAQSQPFISRKPNFLKILPREICSKKFFAKQIPRNSRNKFDQKLSVL